MGLGCAAMRWLSAYSRRKNSHWSRVLPRLLHSAACVNEAAASVRAALTYDVAPSTERALPIGQWAPAENDDLGRAVWPGPNLERLGQVRDRGVGEGVQGCGAVEGDNARCPAGLEAQKLGQWQGGLVCAVGGIGLNGGVRRAFQTQQVLSCWLTPFLGGRDG